MNEGWVWRLLETPSARGNWNMAVDEVLMESHKMGAPPVLRLYSWSPPAISFGYFQKPADEIDIERCASNGIDYVRRLSGGRGVLHDKELTYSVIIKESLLPGSIPDTYKKITTALVKGLTEFGMEASSFAIGMPAGKRKGKKTPLCFDTTETADLTFKDKKIIGSAQVRIGGIILQHGSLPIFNSLEKFINVLKISEAGKRALLVNLSKKCTSLAEEGYLGPPSASWEEVLPSLSKALQKGFYASFGVSFEDTPLSAGEKTKAAELADEKYGTRGWNIRD